jgi:hypothetical protein
MNVRNGRLLGVSIGWTYVRTMESNNLMSDACMHDPVVSPVHIYIHTPVLLLFTKIVRGRSCTPSNRLCKV